MLAGITEAGKLLIPLAERLWRRKKDEPKNGPLKFDFVLQAAVKAAEALAKRHGAAVPTPEQVIPELQKLVAELNGDGTLDRIAAGLPEDNFDPKEAFRKLQVWSVQP